MTKEHPLWHRLYFDHAYADVARMVGYVGMTYRDFAAGLQTLIEKHGRKAESASWHVVTFEGQMTCNPKPLAHVQLRAEVRKLCWQLLGPPPEHPEYEHFQSTEPFPFFKTTKPKEAKPAPVPTEAVEHLRKLNKRQLACQLRDERFRLKHNGKRSFVGKQAKQQLALIEAEYQRRGLPIPPQGEEVPDKREPDTPAPSESQPTEKGEPP